MTSRVTFNDNPSLSPQGNRSINAQAATIDFGPIITQFLDDLHRSSQSFPLWRDRDITYQDQENAPLPMVLPYVRVNE